MLSVEAAGEGVGFELRLGRVQTYPAMGSVIEVAVATTRLQSGPGLRPGLGQSRREDWGFGRLRRGSAACCQAS